MVDERNPGIVENEAKPFGPERELVSDAPPRGPEVAPLSALFVWGAKTLTVILEWLICR
jgi:hypothetical protein